MAKEATSQQVQATPAAEAPPSSSFNLKKILLIGVPIVLIQVVLLYFIFAKFIAPGMSQSSGASAQKEDASAEKKESQNDGKEGEPGQVMVIKDLIVNPAGTNGTRFLLTTIGIEVPSVEIRTELEQKEVQTRDILNTILTSKGLDELTVPQFKEQLKKEMAEKLNATLSHGRVTNIYFSKFIIQ